MAKNKQENLKKEVNAIYEKLDKVVLDFCKTKSSEIEVDFKKGPNHIILDLFFPLNKQ